MMDLEAQDQREAYVRDMREFALNLHITYLSFREAGFRHRDAMKLLVASFVQNAGVVQAQAMDRMVAELRDDDDDCAD